MTGKRFALVGLFVFAALIGAPRPAQAQWIDFMKWLSSLDPGPFEGTGGNYQFLCQTKGGGWVTSSKKKNIFLCGEAIRPSQARTIAGLPTQVRSLFGVSFFKGHGPHNLTYPTPPPEDRMNLFMLSGTYDYRLNRAIDVGAGIGYTHFTGGVESPTKLLLNAHYVFRAPHFTVWDAFTVQFSTRLDFQVFPSAIKPKDFGAIDPAGYERHGGETMTAISFGLSFSAVK